MAKYTMLLAEYLAKGGALPSSFALIDGFENAFIGRYFDKEIGFETMELFALKLEAKADLIMQAYKERIAERAYYWAKVENPAKVYYEHAHTKYNMGEQKISTTELPFDSETAEPNVINKNEAYENNDARFGMKKEQGASIDELMRMLDFLNKDVTTLVEKCLNEFKPLFMAVY